MNVPESQKADIETSSEDYAKRFSGNIGAYFLEVQTNIILDFIKPWPKAKVLDVGGGHAQIAVPLVKSGYDLTIAGSDDICELRLKNFLEEKDYKYRSCNLLNLPYDDKSFDVVTCFRLLTHEDNWKIQIKELCRVARFAVILDYPEIKSFNIFYKLLFHVKRKYEGNTRTFKTFSRQELAHEFSKNSFSKNEARGEFFLPMVIYRALKNVKYARLLENIFLVFGLTNHFGSPVILKVEPGSL